MYLAHKVFQVNNQELKKVIERKARYRARQLLLKMRTQFKVGESYSGREVKAMIKFMIQNVT